jgi:hypothetical protein
MFLFHLGQFGQLPKNIKNKISNFYYTKYMHIYKKSYDLVNVHKKSEQYEEFWFVGIYDIPWKNNNMLLVFEAIKKIEWHGLDCLLQHFYH